jgi:bifunctional non-homologous end joining protein LigD
MRQHYKPMLASLADSPFDSKNWIFEIKWDGIRAISYVNDELAVRSRNDKELLHSFPELVELSQLAPGTVLDGEIVIVKGGETDFQALLERSKTGPFEDSRLTAQGPPALYIVFDILEKDGKSLVDLPLEERKKILKNSVKEGEHVLLSDFVEERGEEYYEAALKKGLEGVMAKKKDSRYELGIRSRNWLKIKKIHSCDCVIFGYTVGQGSRSSTFGALILGLYDKEKPLYVGKAGAGFSEETLQALMDAFKPLKSEKKSLEGVDVSEKVSWVKPELVCEVAYQTVTKDFKLRMPRFKGLRIDKNPSECTVEQLKKASLQEYASKRDFASTPEPKANLRKSREGKTFVVQEHHARRLHYDLRLEKEGVLKSWAVPKGIPTTAGDRRLAVQTEDHPLEYSEFEGAIPQGHYGAGTVKIWDSGTYELKSWEIDKVEFSLHGQVLHGKYVLVKFKKAGEKEWILLKTKD